MLVARRKVLTALSGMGSGLRLEASRRIIYKDHHIEVSVQAAGDSKGWVPDILVSYSDHGKGVLNSLRMDQTFASPDKAEQAEIAFAQKWIDDGKPGP